MRNTAAHRVVLSMTTRLCMLLFTLSACGLGISDDPTRPVPDFGPPSPDMHRPPRDLAGGPDLLEPPMPDMADMADMSSPPDLATPVSCYDGIQNQGESGIDCGGPCLRCNIGVTCNSDSDCTTGACNTTCVAATGLVAGNSYPVAARPQWPALVDLDGDGA
jgi:hypothetical protein